MREDLKGKLDESVPEDVTLSDAKKRQILLAAQEQGEKRKPSRVPKLVPALVGVAVIGLSGLLAYPYLIEETNAPQEIRNAEENEPSIIEGNDSPESPPAVVEEPEKNIEERIDKAPEEDIEEPAVEVIEEDGEESADETVDEEENVVEDTESQPLTIEEKFIELLDHEFYGTGIELGDEVVEIESNYPNWIEKGEVEGGLVTNYGSFMIIYPHFEDHINYVALMEFNQLTVSQIEEVIGQEIELETNFNESYSMDVTSGRFILENKSYFIVAETESKGAKVNQIWITAYVGE